MRIFFYYRQFPGNLTLCWNLFIKSSTRGEIYFVVWEKYECLHDINLKLTEHVYSLSYNVEFRKESRYCWNQFKISCNEIFYCLCFVQCSQFPPAVKSALKSQIIIYLSNKGNPKNNRCTMIRECTTTTTIRYFGYTALCISVHIGVLFQDV